MPTATAGTNAARPTVTDEPTGAQIMRLKAPPSPEIQRLQKEFAARLAKLMQDKGMSQSDLARQIWGATTDSRGYSVARNRDRISAYLAGAGMPEPANLEKLAAALGCTAEDLLGEGVTRPVTRGRAQVDVQLATVPGQPGWMQVNVNMIMPMAKAMEILKIIEELQPEDDEPAGGDEK